MRARDRQADAPPRKPLSAIDELSGIDHSLRRRALASEADHEPRPIPDVAPPPGADPPAAARADDEAVSVAAPPARAAEVQGPVTAPAAKIASAPLEALGVVQLSERLALAIQARRARSAPKSDSNADTGFEEPSPALTAAELDVITPDCDDAGETAKGVYSSLLALGSGFGRRDAVRIEEPQSDGIEPLVAFPGQVTRTPGQPSPGAALDVPVISASRSAIAAGAPSAADADATDRALRAALASLQRISGAR